MPDSEPSRGPRTFVKIALVHDWLIHMRGGEKVLDALAELYPEATVYTLFSDKKKLSPNLQRLEIKNSFLQYLPGIRRYYRWLLFYENRGRGSRDLKLSLRSEGHTRSQESRAYLLLPYADALSLGIPGCLF